MRLESIGSTMKYSMKSTFALIFCLSLLSCVTKQVDVKGLPPEVDALDAAMQVQKTAFMACYATYQARGKIVLEFMLDHLGQMSNSKINYSDLTRPQAEPCFLKVLGQVKFPPQKNDFVVVKYPFYVK
jgi:hypothetical protein